MKRFLLLLAVICVFKSASAQVMYKIKESPVISYSFKVQNVNTKADAKSITDDLRSLFNGSYPEFNDSIAAFSFTAGINISQAEVAGFLAGRGHSLVNFTKTGYLNTAEEAESKSE